MKSHPPTPAGATQIIVDRSIEADADWLELVIEPSWPGVFSWDQVIFSPTP